MPAVCRSAGSLDPEGSVDYIGAIADAPFTRVTLINPLGREFESFGLGDLTIAPVPEPHTHALMLAGVAMVAWNVRRRAAATSRI